MLPPTEIPPHDERAERDVIACSLTRDGVVADLPVDAFYVPHHRLLWSTILALREDGARPDPHLLLDRLQREGKVGPVQKGKAGSEADILDLGDIVPTSANVEVYARHVRAMYEKREQLKRMNGAARAAYDPHVGPDEVRSRLAAAVAVRPPTEITVSTNVQQMVDEAEAALAASNRDRFHRLGELVRVVDVDGRLRIAALPRPALVEDLAAAARWVRLKKSKDDEVSKVPALPTREAVDALAARGVWPKLRELRAVVDCPTLRADGTVCQVPGYDAESKVLYLASVDYPKVPEKPTKGEAGAALTLIDDDVFGDFEFAAASDRSTALALVLTVVARQAIDGPTPMIVSRATTPGTGKTIIVDAVAAITLGLHEAPRLGQPDSEDEIEKQFVSMGRESMPMALFDNLTKPLGNATLARALTSRCFTGRLLGHNTLVDVVMPVLCASGNNLQVASDLHRRVLPIDLVTEVENPEERADFKHRDLIAHVLANRPRLLVAALTVLRWWYSEGCPVADLPTFGSYTAWSHVVRNVLAYLGRPDPCAGRDRIRDEGDPERDAHRTMLATWFEAVGPRALDAAELVETAKRNLPLRDALVGVDSRWNPELLEARAAIGYGMRRFKGRILDGLRLENGASRRNGRTTWRVVDVSPPRAGEAERA